MFMLWENLEGYICGEDDNQDKSKAILLIHFLARCVLLMKGHMIVRKLLKDSNKLRPLNCIKAIYFWVWGKLLRQLCEQVDFQVQEDGGKWSR